MRKEGERAADRRVLPTAPLDVSRLRAMNADVRVDAAKVVNARRLPLDRMGVHVRLRDGVLVLDPLDLGVAGGRLAGTLRIDATAQPVAVQTRLDARSLELSRLYPQSESVRNSFGKIQGQLDLVARGRSVAQMLASAEGHLALLMGKGQISNLLLEFAGLDGGEIMKFLVKGDDRVRLRCAATSFDVTDGLMTSRALVLDTDDTVFDGGGTVNLARETLDIVIRPSPKDTSILSLRSPLHIAGSFGAPDVGPDKGALAGRAGPGRCAGRHQPPAGPGSDRRDRARRGRELRGHAAVGGGAAGQGAAGQGSGVRRWRAGRGRRQAHGRRPGDAPREPARSHAAPAHAAGRPRENAVAGRRCGRRRPPRPTRRALAASPWRRTPGSRAGAGFAGGSIPCCARPASAAARPARCRCRTAASAPRRPGSRR